MTEQIKPCPFCGEMPIPYARHNISKTIITSVRCKTDGCPLNNINPAGWIRVPIQDWNTRPEEDRLRAKRDKLAKGLRRLVEPIIQHDYCLLSSGPGKGFFACRILLNNGGCYECVMKYALRDEV